MVKLWKNVSGQILRLPSDPTKLMSDDVDCCCDCTDCCDEPLRTGSLFLTISNSVWQEPEQPADDVDGIYELTFGDSGGFTDVWFATFTKNGRACQWTFTCFQCFNAADSDTFTLDLQIDGLDDAFVSETPVTDCSPFMWSGSATAGSVVSQYDADVTE